MANMPKTTMAGFITELERAKTPDDIKKVLNSIIEELQRMHQIIRDDMISVEDRLSAGGL